MVKPLFKWTGGKNRLLEKYTNLNFFPDSSEFDTYVDLFAGGGATFLWVANRYPDKKLIINDLNTELITMYLHIRNEWDKFLPYYEKYVKEFMKGDPKERKELYDSYKPVYSFEYEKYDPIEISALLLVMMKTNFNGIWKNYIKWNNRYSTPAGTMTYKEGLFNVGNLIQFRDVLRKAEVLNLCYSDVVIPERSWVFADPPYRDSEKMYSDQFDDEDQVKLSEYILKHECLYAESNKEIGDEFWNKLYPSNNINYLDHKYTCGQGDSTKHVTEVLIKNYGNNIQKQPTLTNFFS